MPLNVKVGLLGTTDSCWCELAAAHAQFCHLAARYYSSRPRASPCCFWLFLLASRVAVVVLGAAASQGPLSPFVGSRGRCRGSSDDLLTPTWLAGLRHQHRAGWSPGTVPGSSPTDLAHACSSSPFNKIVSP